MYGIKNMIFRFNNVMFELSKLWWLFCEDNVFFFYDFKSDVNLNIGKKIIKKMKKWILFLIFSCFRILLF